LDIWRFRLKDKPKTTSFLFKILRVLILSLREFHKDKCQLRASSLTYYTLLSIVPIIAMAFGVAKGFGFEEKLRHQILDAFDAKIAVVTNITPEIVQYTNIVEDISGSGYFTNFSSGYLLITNIENRVVSKDVTGAEINDEENRAAQFLVLEKTFEFSSRALAQTSGGLIFGIGIALLFWSVIKALGQVENSFNAIWGVKKGRHIGRKFTDYLSVLLLCPILLILAGSIPVLIRSQLDLIVSKISLLGPVATLIYNLLRLSPYVVTWILFSFIFIFMPNTKIKLSSGIISGIITGTLFQLFLWVYITFQLGISKFSAIYGSFAALPLFLAWVQVTWLIALFGSEIAFAHQNVDTFEFEPDCLKASLSFKKLVSLCIVQVVARRFANAEKPLSADELTRLLGIPIRLMRELIFQLVGAGVLDEVKTEDPRIIAYQPALDVHLITPALVLESLDNLGTQTIPFTDSNEAGKLSDILKSFGEVVNKSPENVPLVEI